MITRLVASVVPFIALIWGGSWALCLQRTSLGRYLAAQRAWLAVIIGVGGDLLLLRLLLPRAAWLRVCAVIGASSAGIIARSILNEHRLHQELIERLDDAD